ncbi:MAG: TatD family hydrolase, partial [Desulfovibrio sp.]|nr:TatD family hydrolase [Desulfovibrio sp.]
GGVDSHAHLDDKAFDDDREEVLARANACGVSQIVNIFLNPITFSTRSKLFADHPNIAFALGIHPCDGTKFGQDGLDALEEAHIHDPRLVAVGEIGLDYHWDDCPKELQIALFKEQLHLAKTLHKPVVVHCREAEEDCLLILESQGMQDYPLLWHCFGGDSILAKRILHNGWFISVPGAVTYKGNAATRLALSIIPRDRLLLETDAPYLAPMPWRGTRNESAYTVFTVRVMAQAMGMGAEELWLQCGENAKNFFGLKV